LQVGRGQVGKGKEHNLKRGVGMKIEEVYPNIARLVNR